MKRQSKLKFTEDELATPKLEKPISKSQKYAKKLDKAETKIPKKKIAIKERILDEPTGKSKVRLKFEEVDKAKPLSKLEHARKVAPARAVINELHKEIEKDEDNNISLKAVHSTEKGAEFTGRRISSVYRSVKRKPYEQLLKAQKKSIKADVNYLYKKSQLDKPTTSSNPISKWQQKQAIKKSYMANHYTKGTKTAKNTASATKKVGATMKKGADVVVKTVSAVVKNPKVLLVLGCILLVSVLVMSMFSSISTMFQGALNSVISTSYTSEDAELIATNNNFTTLETNLQNRIDNIESEYSGYDEYRYDLDSIQHDPHELAAYLTALKPYFTAREMQSEIERLFNKMYKLTTTRVVEIRYRTETRTGSYTDSKGNSHSYSYTVQVPYNYYILNVKLTSKSINEVANATLTAEQLEMYHIYRQTLGNKPLLFGGGAVGGSPSTDLSGVEFVNGERAGNQNTVNIAMSQVGNVGGQPYWSWYGFGGRVEWCACYVSWVLNQAGYSEPKFAACQSQGVPYFSSKGRWANKGYKDIAAGDVIFFDWEGDGSSDHVGIVIGTDGNRVYTVEGNSGDACKVRDYDLNSSVIMGYGLMN